MNKKEQNDNLDALLRHAIRSAPMPEIPADFALKTSRRACDHSEEATTEIWLVRILLIVSAIATTTFAVVATDTASVLIVNLLEASPWPLLLAAACIFGGIKILEVKNGGINKLAPFKTPQP
jgi:hypothetical protein